jgi:hypothetical protein
MTVNRSGSRGIRARTRELCGGMRLAEMFSDQDTRTFEERRAEVVAIVRSAADFSGAELGLRAMFQHICDAHDENEFDAAFDVLAASLSESATSYFQSA